MSKGIHTVKLITDFNVWIKEPDITSNITEYSF